MNEEKNTGSIFDAIDAAQENTDEELSEISMRNTGFSEEIEVDDTSESDSPPVFSDDLSSEPAPMTAELEETRTESSRPETENGADEDGADAEAQGDNLTTLNEDKSEIKPFEPQKMSAKDAMDSNGGRRPPVLNKQFILYCIIGVFALLVIFALFIFPEITRKRERSAASRPVATENTVTDYSKLVGERYPDKPSKPAETEPGTDDEIDEIIENLPPVNDRYAYKEPPQQNNYSGGGNLSGSGYEIPDTRTDALQSKSISGIKGISSTQRNYLTPDNASAPYNNAGNAQTAGGSGSVSSGASNPYARFGLPDQATYTNQLLSQYSSGNNSYTQQNDQGGKSSFYNQGRGSVSGQWLPLNSIWQGTIFDATLTSDISTDLPGECTAVVTKNIYSSQDGRYLLIPQNSKLYGSYNSSISYSQSRVQVGWHTLIRPDGYMVNLGNFNATDTRGASGLRGAINDHPFAYLKAIILMSAVNIVNSELQTTAASSSNEYVQNVMANSQEVATTLGEKLIDRAMDVQPTIRIKAGTTINIVANTTLELPVLEPWEVTEPYRRNQR